MMVMTSILIAIGAFFGAISRFSLTNLIKRHFPIKLPIATLLINVTGAFLLGMIFGIGASSSWRLLLGTGFMGAFTTFSTFKVENIQLFEAKEWKVLITYIGLSYVLGIGLAFCGMLLGISFAS